MAAMMSLSLIRGVPQSVHSFVNQSPTFYNPKKLNLVVGGNSTFSSNDFGKTRLSSGRQALVDILRDCAGKGSLEATKSVHGFVLKSEFSESDLLVLLNHVAHAYTKSMVFSDARRVFDEMTQRNVFSYTVMIFGSAENGFFLDGVELFLEMLGRGILPNKFSYSAILQTCIGLDYVEFGKMVHAQIVKNGVSSQIYVAVALLNMYAKLGLIEDSYGVFSNITEHNGASWNAMISMYASNGFHEEAYDLFIKMQSKEVSPDMYTIISVSKAIVKLRDIEKGREAHRCASVLGLDSNVLVGTALIDMYSKCESLVDAKSIFDANFSRCKINSPWNAMISGFTQSNQTLEALELFVKMHENNVRPDFYTYCSVFSAIASLKDKRFAKQVHGMALKSRSESEIGVSNAIADAYSKNSLIEETKKVFEGMGERDIVSWTTMINAHSQASEYEEALVTFAKMREEGFFPNEFTFSTVLDSCASLSLLDFARQIHGLMCKSGQIFDKCTESALIDTYSKCGFIADARAVFEGISNPDTVSWTAIISGHAQHGLVKEALKLFEKMEKSGEKVNSITMLCILFACSHGGLVEEGLNYFRRMQRDYDLAPEMEHYACIVDLLGRAGRLSEAMEFIDEMPVEPDEMVWQTLLGACRVHGNLELGEKAAEKILSINPRYSATYVLLSNTYAESGSREDGVSLRHLMKNRGVRKEAGCSWISVKGKLNKFYAGDQSHPRRDLVFAKLMELRTAIESFDYVPDLSYEQNLSPPTPSLWDQRKMIV